MQNTIQVATEVAPSIADRICKQSPVTPDSSEERPWFSKVSRVLYPKDAGLALHLLTGIEERSCYRHAAGDTKHPPEYVLRALLRSEHGRQWLNAIMDGATPQWWKDLQEALDLSASYTIRRK